jgi:DHA3 family macrolide efflux protein-like MFS transporter
MLGIAGMGIGALITGFAPGSMYWMGVAGVFFLGLMNPITNGPFFALMQSKVEPGFQGRVMTTVNSITSGLTPIAMLIAGPLADKYGIQTWFILGGGICLIIAVLMGTIKTIFTLEDQSGDIVVQPTTHKQPHLV